MHGQMGAAGRHHGVLQERTFFSEKFSMSCRPRSSCARGPVPPCLCRPQHRGASGAADRQAFKPRSWSQLEPAHNRRAMGSKTPGRVGLKAVPGWGKAEEGGPTGMGTLGATATLSRDATVGEPPPSPLLHRLLPVLAIVHPLTHVPSAIMVQTLAL